MFDWPDDWPGTSTYNICERYFPGLAYAIVSMSRLTEEGEYSIYTGDLYEAGTVTAMCPDYSEPGGEFFIIRPGQKITLVAASEFDMDESFPMHWVEGVNHAVWPYGAANAGIQKT